MANIGDVSGFKTYADWQKANRAAGGSGENADVAAHYGAAPPAPTNYPAPPPPAGGSVAAPRPTPAAPTPAPSPTGRGPLPAGGGPAPLTGAGAVLEQNFAQQRGNTDWRDTNVSAPQWGAWEEEERKRFENGTSAQQTTPGGCPPDKPFTGRNGQCAYKPDDCPDGMVVQGSDTNGSAKCVPAGSTGGGPGGGTGGAGGSSSSSTLAASSPGAGGDLAAQMEAVLKGGLSGANSRYNSGAMQGLLASIKQNVESQRKTQQRQATENAVGRGLGRSQAVAGANERAINSAAGQSFTSQYSKVLQDKIDADYQDKMGALDRAQKNLDSLRDEMYRRDMSAIQQQQFKANLDLAYANIQAQRDALASNQQYGKDMLAAQYGYGATFGGM